ncbi:DUF2283 domain-containing protein [Haloechinothrix sp. LS1_15]|uniref:DUF2283 domain-containing protein n=1 Tax=Haloechinothrix sp. LS1_15 TaxID=2652248 RepID=UPI002946C71C|nr:DUF2283 domain-containing protein [Haloechinothrix sp. LS1_15]
MNSKWPVVEVDNEANAAYIGFSERSGRIASDSIPVRSKQGDVIALLDFGPDGQLLGVELLDARKQVPDALRDRIRYLPAEPPGESS